MVPVPPGMACTRAPSVRCWLLQATRGLYPTGRRGSCTTPSGGETNARGGEEINTREPTKYTHFRRRFPAEAPSPASVAFQTETASKRSMVHFSQEISQRAKTMARSVSTTRNYAWHGGRARNLTLFPEWPPTKPRWALCNHRCHPRT